MTGAQRSDDIYDELRLRGMPYVLTSIYLPESAHPTVGYDNREGGRVLATYLADLGHVHIGMVAGPCVVNDRAALRKAGVRDGLIARGLALPDSFVIDRPFSLANGRDGLRHLLSVHPELTAVICGNDVLAMGALFEAQAQGLRVPEDISVVGFDGLDMGMHVRPGLTTIDVHCDRMGACAAESLLARIEGKSIPHATKIDFDFVVRGSSGRPRI
jgi:LacI family transcriptional regulator